MICMYPLFWDQGDIGPVGEMGLPGPNGLKVLSYRQMQTVNFPVLFFLLVLFSNCWLMLLEQLHSVVPTWVTAGGVWFVKVLFNPPVGAFSRGCPEIQENQD